MFQYTNTIVLNSLKDELSGLDKLQDLKDSKKETIGVRILRVNDFKKANVVAMYKREAKDAKAGFVNFATIPSEEGKLYRINLYVRLSGSQNSYYSNDMVFKGRPFVYEYTGGSTAKQIVDLIKNINQLYGDKFLKVEVNGVGIMFTGDNYTLFTVAKIEEFVVDPSKEMIQPSANGGIWKEVAKGEITKCENGFGTYDQILKDLRLPTMESRRWEAVNKEELPVPGTLYDQYTIDYCVERGILGTDAVGDMVTSLTHHVFFVPQTLAATFEGKISPALGTITEVNKDQSMPASLSED